ncbi:MAG: DUF2059 domain-containing protein [Rhizobiaceae bacterium]
MRLSGNPLRLVSMAALVAMTMAGGAMAQEEISDAHLKVAREAIASINATDEFDQILPGAAAELKNQLYQKNPDLQPMISEIVDDVALSLASRRADLEREAALAYARAFTEEELKGIVAFYTSPVGQKFIIDGPVVTRELFKAADIWRVGIGRDLAQETGKRLEEAVKKMRAEGGGSASE